LNSYINASFIVDIANICICVNESMNDRQKNDQYSVISRADLCDRISQAIQVLLRRGLSTEAIQSLIRLTFGPFNMPNRTDIKSDVSRYL
jgi:hypothetical protein